ncbi:MAG: hypothetical protein ACREXY_26840 [Gammaproteobacteria bacterium]
MAWNTSGYKDFAARIDGIENPLSVEIPLDPAVNGGANILCVYTGTVMLGKFFKGGVEVSPSTGNWIRGTALITIPTAPRRWTFIPLPPETIPGETPFTYLFGGTVVVSLASIFNKNVANNAGWAVDGADLYAAGHKDEGLRIETKLALRDSDGFLYRISYQATALGKAPQRPVVVKG